MPAPSLIALTLATALIMIPSATLDALGATRNWELELIRMAGLFLGLYGWATFGLHSDTTEKYSDPALSRATTVGVLAAVLYLVRGDAFVLLVTFCLVVGISLNRLMKRADLAFERANDRMERLRRQESG